MALYLECPPREGEWGRGTGEGSGAPELSEQVESPNKTYLFHLRLVCALCGCGGEETLVAEGLGNCLR